MRITVDVVGDKEIERLLKKMSMEKSKDVRKETYASGIDVQREAKSRLREQKAWDLGNLANSIVVNMVGDFCEIGPEAPYGPYVEYGTKPHFPPPDALEGWARRHGFDSAWPICMAINKRGLKARPYLVPAWMAVVDKFWKRIKEILKK